MNRENWNDKIEKFCDYMAMIRISRKDFLKSLTLLAGTFILWGRVENAYAHPPSGITITFNPTTKILKAIITHHVSNPEKHFIYKVDVGLNDKEIISQKISRQDNNTTQTISYLIPDAKEGDALSVEGYCNISGSLKKSIKITSN